MTKVIAQEEHKHSCQYAIHPICEHDCLHYCSRCDRVYCCSCGRAWGEVNRIVSIAPTHWRSVSTTAGASYYPTSG